ncbi:hypothetical protein C8Q74DRAFT_371739 [Fomes fomentarius]|nr:hypothetical protein C8Q74DRAFT_371739 [Fomes fomentarius]
MVTILPPDKWDLIIDFVAPDVLSGPSSHYPSLRATALTCQTWLPRARFRLYKHVELSRLASIALFARTLTQSPALQALVQRLEFCFMALGDPAWSESTLHSNSVEIPFPLSLIPALSALHRLRFSHYSEWPAHHAIQNRFRDQWAVHKNIRTLWLDNVEVLTLEDLTRFVWSFPLLEELNMFQTSWLETGTAPDPHGYPGHCRNLRKVELDNITLVKEMLPVLGTSIQDLSVSPTWDYPGEDRYEVIAPLQELRRLQLLLYQVDYDWMMSVLSQVSSPRIEELVLYLVHIGSHKDKQALESFAEDGFDEVLSRKPFDSLRCLKIVASGNDKTGKSTWLLQAARTVFPRFAQRGTIQVVLERMLNGFTGEELED